MPVFTDRTSGKVEESNWTNATNHFYDDLTVTNIKTRQVNKLSCSSYIGVIIYYSTIQNARKQQIPPVQPVKEETDDMNYEVIDAPTLSRIC